MFVGGQPLSPACATTRAARYPFHAMKASRAMASICSAAFRIILIVPSLHLTFRTPSVVIRLALQISSATLTTALLLWTGPSSADITELAAIAMGGADSVLIRQS
jgi:hypothetical protein